MGGYGATADGVKQTQQAPLSRDQLVFEFDENGLLRVAPVRKPLPPLRGFLAKDAAGARLDCEQIDEAIRQRMRRKYGSLS